MFQEGLGSIQSGHFSYTQLPGNCLGLHFVMKKPEKYFVPLIGIAIIFLVIYRDLMEAVISGVDFRQAILVSAGLAIIVVSLRFDHQLILCLKSLKDCSGGTLMKVAVTTVALYLVVDLLLGGFYPEVHIPTRYGWSVTARDKANRRIENTKDNYREVVVQHHANGFKRWPIDHGSKTRVLVIGDSFTEMDYVSNGEEWYAYLEREFPEIAFYVFGAGGYGTLQEYMVLDEYFDEIVPQAVIWQFCRNDFGNNYYDLDRQDYPLNIHTYRPYWENGSIVYKLPLPFANLRKISFTADRLLKLYDDKRRIWAQEDIAAYLNKKAEHDKMSIQGLINSVLDVERKAIEVTRELAREIRLRVGDIPVYFFNACGSFDEDTLSVCEAGGFQCQDFIYEYMQSLADKGIQVVIENDGHWNLAGNEYAGRKLVEYFKNNGGIIPDRYSQKADSLSIGPLNQEIAE